MSLFLRIIFKNREVYFLKVVTLAIAFSCSTLILLFCINEFGYDRFHQDYQSVFRILQKNDDESYSGNRLSNKIPHDIFLALKNIHADSLATARVKLMTKVNVIAEGKTFDDARFYAADPEISDIFSFEIVKGSLNEFQEKERTIMLSSSAALKYFGVSEPTGKKLALYTFGDTLIFTVAAVYKDYPQNSHEAFDSFITFDEASIQALNFDPKEAGVYGKFIQGYSTFYENRVNVVNDSKDLSYRLQSLSEIYFGPRVLGEDAKHGDHYSILILICISVLILFLALTSFINLTSLSLPYRAKELAIKKLAGTGYVDLVIGFVKESFLIAGLSLIMGVLILVATANWIQSILSIDVSSLLSQKDLLLILASLLVVVVMAPLFMTYRFIRATPNRLLSTDTITFPRFKRIIIFLQLGISIFLIAASMVMQRQINRSLIKEPGRNHDQVVYLNYPNDLTNEGLINLRATWKRINPNIVDVIATSQLPDRISSKDLNSNLYFMTVDRGFSDFFDVQMIQGNWFKANDGDSIIVANEQGMNLLRYNTNNIVGIFQDISGRFNQPERPVKLTIAAHFNYNFLCVKVLEVDIRKTVDFLSTYFKHGSQKVSVSFLNKRFEEWLAYQDRLNALSEILATISGILSCCAIYGLSISIVRDKLKQIAIHKLCGANTFRLTRLLVREFATQMLMAILIFGPVTYIILNEVLRNFVYSTHFTWLDPFVPLAYCGLVITLLCGFQTLNLNREDLSAALKR